VKVSNKLQNNCDKIMGNRHLKKKRFVGAGSMQRLMKGHGKLDATTGASAASGAMHQGIERSFSSGEELQMH